MHKSIRKKEMNNKMCFCKTSFSHRISLLNASLSNHFGSLYAEPTLYTYYTYPFLILRGIIIHNATMRYFS